VTGSGGLNQTLAVTYANNTNAGTATASASYAGRRGHTGSNGSVNFEIAKAASAVTSPARRRRRFNGSRSRSARRR